MNDFDVIISGGGLNGSSMAIALAQSGFTVALIEPTSVGILENQAFDGRGYALSLASKRLLVALGIWDDLTKASQPILDIKVSDGRAGDGPSPLVLEFDRTDLDEGPMGYMVEDRHLRPVLLGTIADDPQVTQFSGHALVSLHRQPGQVRAELDDGRSISATLLIGADGAKSAVAKQAGMRRIEWDYDQSALVCSVEHERDHNATAHQFFMPSGPLAILPLPGKRSSIVWTETRDVANRLQNADDANYLSALAPRFGDFLGRITLAGERFCYPLSLSLSQSFVSDRIALIGDAAHKIHPIAGQGLNSGLKDIAALAEIVTLAKRRGDDFGRSDVLKNYQSWRRFDSTALAMMTDSFNRLFSNDNSALRAIRDIGLAGTNMMPGLKRSLIREAAGLSGDVPKLMQGRAL